VILVLVFSILSVLSLSFASGHSAVVHPLVEEKLAGEGRVSVIVMLNERKVDAPRESERLRGGRGVSDAQAVELVQDVQARESARAEFLDAKRASAREAKEEFLENLPAEVVVLADEGQGVSSVGPVRSVKLLREYYSIGAVEVEIDAEGLEALKDNPAVAKVLPNLERRIDSARGGISGYDISLNESVPLILGDNVWNLSVSGVNLTGHGRKICVIDTGIDTSHLLFGPIVEASNIVGGVFGGYDFVNNDANASDGNSHGTHVSGIAVGNFSGTPRLMAVAHNAQVVPVKVCTDGGSCPDAAILAGVDYCNNNISGVDVISGSLGGGAPYTGATCSGDSLYSSLEPLFTTSLGLGIIPVFASGNDGLSTGVDYPSCSPQVISVGSTTKSDAVSSFSNRGGDRFDIYAPGTSILSSVPTFSAIGFKDGTSMATPHVSSVIAVIQQNELLNGRPRLNLSQIRVLLQQTGVPIGTNDSRIDVYAAIMRRNLNYSINRSANTVRNDSANTTITFGQAVNFSTAIGCIDLRPNFAGVNSTNCPQFNTTAHVVLGGVTSPGQPYVDGVPCPSSVCQNVTLSGRGLEMDVTGFSNFTSVPGCGITINESASLNQSINATGTCITFGADNIELDCGGFTIGYANETAGVGVNVTGRSNVTIRNCVIRQTNSSVVNADGILLSDANGSLITNVTINTSGAVARGIEFTEANGNLVELSEVNASSQAIDLTSNSHNNSLRHSRAVSPTTTAVLVLGSSSGFVARNNTLGGVGSITVAGGSMGAVVENNSLAGGVSLQDSDHVVERNVMVSLASAGFDIQATNVSVNHNRVSSFGAALIVSTSGLLLVNNTLFASSGSGLLLQGGRNNSFVNSSFATGSGSDAAVAFTVAGFDAQNNTFSNVTLESNATWLSADATATGNNFSQIFFRNASVARVLFQNFTSPASTIVGQSNMSLGANFTRVNATALSFLNQSAQITLMGLPFGNARPMLDENDTGNFSRCDSPQCTIISYDYDSGTFIFNVTGFTSYASEESGGVSISKADSQDPVVRGVVFNYTITVNNSNSFAIFNVTVNDAYPQGVEFISAQPTPTGNDTFNVGTLAATASFQINISVRAGSNLANGTVLNNSASVVFAPSNGTNSGVNVSETTTIRGIPSIITGKADSPDPVPRGATLSYTITVNNTGDEIAYNVTVVEGYPSNTVFNGSAPAPSSGNNTFVIGNLTPNQSTTINITLNVSPSIANGTILNNSYNLSFENLTGAVQTIMNSTTTTVLGSPNLSAVKTDSVDPVFAGDQFVYRINITNTGDDTAFNISVVEGYPTGVSFVSSQPTSTGNNTFAISNLSPSSSFLINITLLVGNDQVNGTLLNNAVNVTFLNRSGESAGTNASENTTVVQPPNLTVSKTVNQSTVIKGTTVNYTITVNNTGDTTAFNVTVLELYPTGVSFVSSEPAPTSGNGTFNVGDLLPNQSTTINLTINFSVTLANATIKNNSLNVTANRSDGRNVTPQNTSSVVTVLGFPQVSVVKSDTPDPVVNGTTLTYVITVTNGGDEIAYNVTVNEGYPANVSLLTTQPVPAPDNATFSIGNLLPGQTFLINITVNVSGNMTSGQLNNSVNVTFANQSGVNTTLQNSTLTTAIPPPVPFAGGGGGGGGGGGSAGVSQTQSMTGQSMTTNYLRMGDKVKFQVNSLEHTMTVLTVLNDRVSIRVASVPQEFTLKRGAVQAVDVTGDGQADVRISVTDIAYSKALFYLEKASFSPAVVREPIASAVPVVEPTPEPVKSPEPAREDVQLPVSEPVQTELADVVPSEGASGSGSLVFFLGGLLLLAVLCGGVLFMRSSKSAGAQESAPKPQSLPAPHRESHVQNRAVPVQPRVTEVSHMPGKSVLSSLSGWFKSPASSSDALAEAKKIEDALREMKKGVKESEHLMRKAEKLDRKGKR